MPRTRVECVFIFLANSELYPGYSNFNPALGVRPALRKTIRVHWFHSPIRASASEFAPKHSCPLSSRKISSIEHVPRSTGALRKLVFFSVFWVLIFHLPTQASLPPVSYMFTDGLVLKFNTVRATSSPRTRITVIYNILYHRSRRRHSKAYCTR